MTRSKRGSGLGVGHDLEGVIGVVLLSWNALTSTYLESTGYLEHLTSQYELLSL